MKSIKYIHYLLLLWPLTATSLLYTASVEPELQRIKGTGVMWEIPNFNGAHREPSKSIHVNMRAIRGSAPVSDSRHKCELVLHIAFTDPRQREAFLRYLETNPERIAWKKK